MGNLPDASNFNIAQINSLLVTTAELESATHKDPILSKVLYYTRKGWPQIIQECLKPYWNRRLELSIKGHTILCGVHVVIPMILHQRVMEKLHQGHSGVVHMKSLAYSHFWWPGVDKEVENLTKMCLACQ